MSLSGDFTITWEAPLIHAMSFESALEFVYLSFTSIFFIIDISLCLDMMDSLHHSIYSVIVLQDMPPSLNTPKVPMLSKYICYTTGAELYIPIVVQKGTYSCTIQHLVLHVYCLSQF